MRLLLDEMYAPAVAAELRSQGHDVVSVHDIESGLAPGAPDADVIAAAQREKRVLVTENVRDFRPLEGDLLTGGGYPGLGYTSSRRFPRRHRATTGRLVRALDAFLRAAPELHGRSIFLQPAGG